MPNKFGILLKWCYNVEVGVSRLNHGLKNWPTYLTSTRFQLKSKLQSVGSRFSIPRTDAGGLSGGFASLKPEQFEPDQSYIKNLAKSS